MLVRVPNIRGAAKVGTEFWFSVQIMCTARGWDAGAIAAVMGIESAGTFAPDAGWAQWRPSRTATGLIQFIESTARRLGVARAASCVAHPELTDRGKGKSWATWTLMVMSAVEQLRLVESYYLAASGGPDSSWRPVDYYVATWGDRAGLPLDHVLAAKAGPKKSLYAANPGLDRNKDGQIQVSDLEGLIMTQYPKSWTEIEYEPPLPDAAANEALTPSERLALGGWMALSVGLGVAGIAGYLWLRK